MNTDNQLIDKPVSCFNARFNEIQSNFNALLSQINKVVEEENFVVERINNAPWDSKGELLKERRRLRLKYDDLKGKYDLVEKERNKCLLYSTDDQRAEAYYSWLLEEMQAAKSKKDYAVLAEKFSDISGYKDCAALAAGLLVWLVFAIVKGVVKNNPPCKEISTGDSITVRYNNLRDGITDLQGAIKKSCLWFVPLFAVAVSVVIFISNEGSKNVYEDVYKEIIVEEIIVPESVVSKSVVINGVRWATHNVDAPGTFTKNPEDAGMFYQWNRNVGWSATDPMVNSNGGTTWNSSNQNDTKWGNTTDPSRRFSCSCYG